MEIPLIDEIDSEILKHRDAHFGGNFDVMIDYYENEGIGCVPDFDVERIRELQAIQEELGENLSIKFLTMPMLEEVAQVKELYIKLREMYDHGETLLPDLILSEEEEPITEIEAIVAQGDRMTDALIYLIDSPNFYNPLYPGYGRTPAFAACCLAHLKTEKAIPHIFNALGGENLDVEEALLASLAGFGQPAKYFLLKCLKNKPITRDNLNAAMGLAFFPLDEEIAKAALELLRQEEILYNDAFAPYLVCLAEGLSSKEDQTIFADLPFPEELKLDVNAIVRSWR